MLQNALRSVLRANEFHQDWEFVFGDDGSLIPGEPIVRQILKDHLNQITFLQSNMSFEDKISQGLTLGRMANEGMKNSKADVAIVLCDDDELVPEYLANISKFFEKNLDIWYAYSKICVYNPILQKSSDVGLSDHKYNRFEGPINPVAKLDISQVAWRLDCCRKLDVWFAETTKFSYNKPWVQDTDKLFFERLYEKCGPCVPTQLVSQYKGIHDYQLVWHKNVSEQTLKVYDNMCKEYGGVKF